ncbi:carbonic anhydrase [Polluticoccus soli]|uniref:carbonic anhydrase n=1 Tax=Polluticoccus soli TaxID=3034150 RepID=UPI0023E0FD24|nr:carbonic anhydrase [Flavipsychrobacter sp. JY13-12]
MRQHEHKILPQDVSPAEALATLKEGNFRFINNLKLNRDLLEQMNDTKDGQWPFAAILSCMDSRTSAELIFDLGLGDIFSIRIAGNIISENTLGSLEYATAVVGSRLIVVLGHTNCGAVKGACDDVQLGHITNLLEKIKPAVANETTVTDNRTGGNQHFVNEVAKINAVESVRQIVEKSDIIRNLVNDGRVGIVPAMYDVATGKVTFYEQDTLMKTEAAAATSVA